jgi:hypothetical protein
MHTDGWTHGWSDRCTDMEIPITEPQHSWLNVLRHLISLQIPAMTCHRIVTIPGYGNQF